MIHFRHLLPVVVSAACATASMASHNITLGYEKDNPLVPVRGLKIELTFFDRPIPRIKGVNIEEIDDLNDENLKTYHAMVSDMKKLAFETYDLPNYATEIQPIFSQALNDRINEIQSIQVYANFTFPTSQYSTPPSGYTTDGEFFDVPKGGFSQMQIKVSVTPRFVDNEIDFDNLIKPIVHLVVGEKIIKMAYQEQK